MVAQISRSSDIKTYRDVKSTTKILIMFPYFGYSADKDSGKIIWELIEKCREYSLHEPIVVVNRDTIDRGKANAFFQENEFYRIHGYTGNSIEILKVWAVDTCQMWLAGWGKIIDDNEGIEPEEKIDRIIQIPGDIEKISNKKDFYDNLQDFCSFKCEIHNQRCYDIVLGDFDTKEFSGKKLVDLYGTFPLLANWFPEISKEIFSLPLYKPRTEFLNIRVDVLKELLIKHRKFAYEQTLNMLIHSWDYEKKDWKYKIKRFNLGAIEDYSGYRQYQGCLDQVERTERMLKQLWRQTHVRVDSLSEKEHEVFMNEYDSLSQRSQDICETARITIKSLLGIGS